MVEVESLRYKAAVWIGSSRRVARFDELAGEPWDSLTAAPVGDIHP